MMAGVQQDKKKRKRKKLDSPNTKKTKTNVAKKSMANLGADEFMASIGQGSDSENEGNIPTKLKVSKDKKKKKNVKASKSNDKITPAVKESSPAEMTEVVVTGGNENIPKSGNLKKGLSNLEEKDSDFFKFLQENDPELLTFGGDGSDNSSEASENEASDNEQVQNDDKTKDAEDEDSETDDIIAEEVAPSGHTSTAVTSALIKKWESALDKNSLPSWKQLVKGFQAAVVTARGDDMESEMKYSITDPDTVNKVMMLCLERSTEVLKHHLGDNPTASPKWSGLKMSLKSYLSSLTELLGLLTSNDVLCAVMRHCKTLLPYYAAFSSLLKKLVKGLITVWGSKAELSRVVAFTTIQALVVKIPTFLEDILKKMYVEYTKCSKMMNPKTRDNIILMRNSLVELFKINPSVTYTTGFLYIRQLAVTLRSVIVSKKEVESVYNWQYINCLHLWVSVLSDCDACLQPLIFPIIQVMMGVVKLHSSACFYPLHMHTIRLILHLAAATNKHIPLIHPLLAVLELCATVTRAPATKPIDLTCVLRVTKGYKKTKAYQDGIFDLTYELLLNYVSQLSQTISFPEVSFPITVWLTKFKKKCNSPKYTGQLKIVLEKIAEVSRDITDRRVSVTFTPKDLEKVTQWEEELPESALTKYFNNWLRIHRTVQASQQAEQEALNDEADDAEKGIKSDEEDDAVDNVESGGDEESEDETKTKSEKSENPKESSTSDGKKLKKKKKKKKQEESNVEIGEFVDTGDVVEDIVLSD